MESLNEHLKLFSAVSLRPGSTSASLDLILRKYGPVKRFYLSSFLEAVDFITPLKSFTTRFLILGYGSWSLVITDMKGENAYVDAYAISRATNCNAIGVALQETRRELQIFEQGEKLRLIQSLLDVDRWYYREEGQLQVWEDATECTKRSKRARLRVEAVRRYFEIYTGSKAPSWDGNEFSEIIGLERSVHEVKVPIVQFETLRDAIRC